MKIIKTKGKIIEIKDLSPTSREVKFFLENPMSFLGGNFINIFTEINGQKVRRAYSISSDSKEKEEITISVRRKKDGLVSKIFWQKNIKELGFEIMGPLGKNTSNKLKKEKVFLFAFGIGVSVIRSILFDLLKNENIKEIFIVTGSYSENEILYKEFFETLRINSDKKIKTRYVLSNPKDKNYKFIGYIQENISDLNFNNSDIYICGQEVACNTLENYIRKTKAKHIDFLIESFG